VLQPWRPCRSVVWVYKRPRRANQPTCWSRSPPHERNKTTHHLKTHHAQAFGLAPLAQASAFNFSNPLATGTSASCTGFLEAQQALSCKTSKPRMMGDGLTTTRYGKPCSTHHCQTFPMHRLSGAPSRQTYRARLVPIQSLTPAHT
jgi:hypothetical protein